MNRDSSTFLQFYFYGSAVLLDIYNPYIDKYMFLQIHICTYRYIEKASLHIQVPVHNSSESGHTFPHTQTLHTHTKNTPLCMYMAMQIPEWSHTNTHAS